MKLLRYGAPGAEKPGMLDRDGAIRCLASVVRDIDGFALSASALQMIAGLDATTLPKVDASARLGSCVARPVNYICIGLNYADHVEETKMKRPEFPLFFNKQSSCVTGPGDPIHLPRASSALDYEGELGFIIGRRCRHVPRDRAHEEEAVSAGQPAAVR